MISRNAEDRIKALDTKDGCIKCATCRVPKPVATSHKKLINKGKNWEWQCLDCKIKEEKMESESTDYSEVNQQKDIKLHGDTITAALKIHQQSLRKKRADHWEREFLKDANKEVY